MTKNAKKTKRRTCPECSNIFYVSEKNHKKEYCSIKCTNKHHNRLKCETLKKTKGGQSMNPKETVKASVLQVLINNHPQVKNHLVQNSHHKHKMSGLQRLRELKADGIISYDFDRKTNYYFIHTSKTQLERAYIEELKKRGR